MTIMIMMSRLSARATRNHHCISKSGDSTKSTAPRRLRLGSAFIRIPRGALAGSTREICIGARSLARELGKNAAPVYTRRSAAAREFTNCDRLVCGDESARLNHSARHATRMRASSAASSCPIDIINCSSSRKSVVQVSSASLA